MKTRYFGLHRAVVIDNIDPEQRMRVKVRIPSVLGDATSWAEPCIPPESAAVPEEDAQVWVEFEAGDPDRPVWMGTLG